MPQDVHTIAGLPARTTLAYAFLCAAAVCLYSAVWTTAPVMQADSGSYIRTAQDLSGARIDYPLERPPGYPILLLLTGSSQSPTRVLLFVSLLLHVGSVWLLGVVLHRAGLKQGMLILFGCLLLLPLYMEPAGYVLTENLTEAMLVLGFAGLVFWLLEGRRTWLFVSAAAIGYAVLTRPTYQLLAVSIAGYLLVTVLLRSGLFRLTHVMKTSAVLVCGSLSVLATFALINDRFLGHPGVSPVLGLALTQKTLRVLERLPDEHAAVRDTLIRGRNAALLTGEEHTGHAYVDSLVPELMHVTGLTRAELSSYLLRLNLLLIRRAPGVYLQEVAWAFGTYWLPASGELANQNSRFLQLLWGIIHSGVMAGFATILILLIGAATYLKACGLRVRRRVVVSEALLLWTVIYGLAATIVFYTAAISCLVQDGIARYRVPTDPLVIFMLFLGTHLWIQLVDASGTLLATDAHDMPVVPLRSRYASGR